MRTVPFIALVSLFAPIATLAQVVPQRAFGRPLWTSSEAFSGPVSVRVLSDGRLLVADPTAREVWFLGSDGRQLRKVGREGQGPAEYSVPLTLLPLPADSTLLVDRRLRRTLVIGPTGVPTLTQRFPEPVIEAVASAAGTDAAGRVVLVATTSPIVSGEVPLLRWDRASGRLDTIARVHLPARERVALPQRSSYAIRVVMYAPQDGWAMTPDGGVVVARVRDYHLDFISPSGATRSGPPIAFTPVPVSDEERRRYGSPITDVKMAFNPDRILVSPDGEVWVGRYGPSSAPRSEWDVFDSNGRRIATIAWPTGTQPVALSRNRVYVTRIDDDGLRWIESYAR
jgi:hypothetical protein